MTDGPDMLSVENPGLDSQKEHCIVSILNRYLMPLVAFVTLLAASVIETVVADTGEGRMLTIYKAECPAGYVGDASADECDSNPVPGVPFQVGRPFTDAFYENVPTDAEGLVTFEFDGLPLDGTLRVIESVPSGTERFVVYCVDESNAALDITYGDYSESNPDIGVADVAVGSDGDVRCDWYNVPRAASSVNRDVTSCSLGVRLAGEPEFWVIPNAPGYGNTDRGRLRFGVLVENCSLHDTLAANVIFRSYDSDGTPYADCSRITPLDLGAGAADNIAPGETAWVTCEVGSESLTLRDLQVSARIREAIPRQLATSVDYEVTAPDFAPDAETSDPMVTGYAPSALVRSTLDEYDTLAQLLFRFYDDRGVQVGTCESDVVIVEPGISRKVTCFSPIRIDAVSPQPTRVEAVPLPCDVPPDSSPVLTKGDRLCR
jgi:hypothetical protein